MKRLYIQRHQKGSPVGRTHRLDLQPNWTIYDVLDESRKYLNYEYDSNLQASYQDKVLDLSSSADDLQDHSLLLISEVGDVELKAQSLPGESSLEIKLREKALNFYGEYLPKGFSIQVCNLDDYRCSYYDSKIYVSEKELLEKNEEVFVSKKDFGIKLGSDVPLVDLEAGIHHQRIKAELTSEGTKNSAKEAVVSTICYSYVKKFKTKLTLDENILKTAKNIILVKKEKERYEALNEVLSLMENFDENPVEVPLVPFFCGGSFTVDAIARSSTETEFSVLCEQATKTTEVFAAAKIPGWRNKASIGIGPGTEESTSQELENSQVKVTIQYRCKPDNCKNVEKVCKKLDKDVKYWSLFPNMQKIKTQKIVGGEVLKMIRESAKNSKDKVLEEAAKFIEQYMKFHNHFVFLGPSSTINKVSRTLFEESTLHCINLGGFDCPAQK